MIIIADGKVEIQVILDDGSVKKSVNDVDRSFSNFLDFIKALVTLDFECMKEGMKNQMETSKELNYIDPFSFVLLS